MPAWFFWGLAFWLGLVFAHYAPNPGILALLLAVIVSLALVMAGSVVYASAVAPVIARRRPAVAVPPPPEGAEPDAQYRIPPRRLYPVVEVMRGQCGWIHMRLRVDRRGRIRAYQVIDQAPARLFEAATVQALRTARLPPGPPREARSLVTFVTPGPDAPEWALARLDPSSAKG